MNDKSNIEAAIKNGAPLPVKITESGGWKFIDWIIGGAAFCQAWKK